MYFIIFQAEKMSTLVFGMLHSNLLPQEFNICLKSFMLEILHRHNKFTADDFFHLDLEFLQNVSKYFYIKSQSHSLFESF